MRRSRQKGRRSYPISVVLFRTIRGAVAADDESQVPDPDTDLEAERHHRVAAAPSRVRTLDAGCCHTFAYARSRAALHLL